MDRLYNCVVIVLSFTLFVYSSTSEGSDNVVDLCMNGDRERNITVSANGSLDINLNIMQNLDNLSCSCQINSASGGVIRLNQKILFGSSVNIFEPQCGSLCRYFTYRKCSFNECNNVSIFYGTNENIKQQFDTDMYGDLSRIYLFLRWRQLEGFDEDTLGTISFETSFGRTIGVKCESISYTDVSATSSNPTTDETSRITAITQTDDTPHDRIKTSKGKDSNNMPHSALFGTALGVVVAVVIAIIVLLIVIFMFKKRKKTMAQNSDNGSVLRETEDQSVRYVSPMEMQSPHITDNTAVITTMNPTYDTHPADDLPTELPTEAMYAVVNKQKPSSPSPKQNGVNANVEADTVNSRHDNVEYFEDREYSCAPELPPRPVSFSREVLQSKEKDINKPSVTLQGNTPDISGDVEVSGDADVDDVAVEDVVVDDVAVDDVDVEYVAVGDDGVIFVENEVYASN